MTLLMFRVVAGVVAVLAVTAMESHVLTRLFDQAIAAVSVAIGS
jgi:hypothetical protein